jgi:hypothetical protein
MDKRGQEGMRCPHHDSGSKKIFDLIKNTVKNTINKIEWDGSNMDCRSVDVVLAQKRELSKEEIHAKRKEATQSANNAYELYRDVHKTAQEGKKTADQAQSDSDKHFENMKSESNKILESIKMYKIEQKKLNEKFEHFAGKIEKNQREKLNDELNLSLKFMKKFINDMTIDIKVINASSDQIRDIIKETQSLEKKVEEHIQFMNSFEYSTKQEKKVLITLNEIKDILENKIHQPLENLLLQVELEEIVQEEAIKAQEGFREKANETQESLSEQENSDGVTSVVLLPKSREMMENSQKLAEKANEEVKRSRIEIGNLLLKNLLLDYDESLQGKLFKCEEAQEISSKDYVLITNKRNEFDQNYNKYIKSIEKYVRSNTSKIALPNKYEQNVKHNYKDMIDSIIDYNENMRENDLKDLYIGKEVLESLHAIDESWKELLPLVKKTREARQEALDLKSEAKSQQKKAKEYYNKYLEQMRKYKECAKYGEPPFQA